MKSNVATERKSREADAHDLKLAVREVLTAGKASDRRIAEHIDIAPSLLSRRLDPDEKQAHLQLVDVVRMPDEILLGVLRAIAARVGCDVVPSGQAMDVTSAVLAASGMLADVSATATSLIAASEDGRLDRGEALPLRARAVNARDRLSGLIRQCDVAINDGVTPLHGNPNCPRGEA